MELASVLVAVSAVPAESKSWWDIATAIGTVGATTVAVALGLYQWSKDLKRQRDVRAALARALRTDLDTWRAVVDSHQSSFDNNELRSEAQCVAWVNALKLPTMPAHERFYMMLPDLGPSISRKVVHAYAEAMRVGEVIAWEATKSGVVDRDYPGIASKMRPHLTQLQADLKAASDVLRPFE